MSVLNNVIKYYENVTNQALINLKNEKNFQFKKMLTNRSLQQSVNSHYEKYSRSNEGFNMIKEYNTKMSNMYKLAQKDYNKTLKLLKNTKDIDEKQKLLNDFANQGITGFISKDGKKWNIETYSNMLTTHFNNEMVRLNILENSSENAIFKISNHAGSCSICIPFEGKVVNRQGLEVYRNEGLFHVRCKHYFVEVTE